MKIHINTKYYKAFKWIHSNGIHFIGYLTGYTNLEPTPGRLEKLFRNCDSINKCKEIITGLNGVFSIIIEKENQVFAASDPSRFFTLFYATGNNQLFLSDDVYWIREQAKSRIIDSAASEYFLSAAFCGGNKTLFGDVYQLESGEIIEFKGDQIRRAYYYSATRNQDDLDSGPYHELKAKASSMLDKAFERVLLPHRDKQILLPLSGGIDSRLIACKLKEFGFTKVVCFTYGRMNPEVEISEKVARELGFEWHFVEYTRELIKNFHNDPEFYKYSEYASRGVSMFYLQEYPAIKFLLEKNIITPEYVAIPGHPGDFIRGSLILRQQSDTNHIKKISSLILRKKFIHSSISQEQKKRLMSSIRERLSALKTDVKNLSYSVQEDWELKERTCKYIMNSSHAFTFFGIRCYFPLADRQLADLFLSFPLNARKFGKLYNEVLFENYFKAHNLDFRNDIQPSRIDFTIARLKKSIYPILPNSIKNKLMAKNDWTFYGPMTAQLEQELKQEGVTLKPSGNTYLYRILNWYLWKMKP